MYNIKQSIIQYYYLMVEIQKLVAPNFNLLHSNSCAVRMSRHSSTSPTFSLSSFGHVCSIGTPRPYQYYFCFFLLSFWGSSNTATQINYQLCGPRLLQFNFPSLICWVIYTQLLFWPYLTPPPPPQILMFFFLTLLFFIQVFDRSCFQKISSQPKTGLIVLALVI